MAVIDDKFVVTFGGDKGGSLEANANYTKFAFNIIKKENPQDFSSFSVYAMCNAPDIYENMSIFHSTYIDQIQSLMSEISPLGKKLLCILNGDFAHLSAMLGHQGAMSKYPSPFTLITQDHLQNYHKDHPLEPHNKENPNCVFPWRDSKSFQLNFMKGSTNDKNCMRKDGKNNSSIIGPTLFPIPEGLSILKNVVAGPVHITSGIFQILETEFRNDLCKLDKLDENEVEEIDKVKEELKKVQEELNDHECMKTKLANNWIFHQDVVNSLQSEDEEVGDDACCANVCFISNQKDEDWVICEETTHENKDEWFHAICEGKNLIHSVGKQ